MMASPQKENGYTPIANEILDRLMSVKLNGTQFRIIMAVWRYTYGFSRKETDLSLTFLSQAVNVDKAHISREMKPLYKRRILITVKSSTFNNATVVAFNKNYEEWLLLPESITVTENGNTDKTATVAELGNTTVAELGNTTVAELGNQDKQGLKQGLKQTLKQEDTPAPLLDSPAAKIPYQAVADKYNAICVSLPSVQRLNKGRKSVIKARLEDFKNDMEIFESLFRKAQASDFLAGRKPDKDFRASFDWLLAPKNYPKVLEGNYDNRAAPYSYGGEYGGDKDGDSL